MGYTSEKEFLAEYDINQYDRPSIAADIVVFSIGKKVKGSYRRLPSKTLRLLMIQRGGQPFQGAWALPGGFMKKGETLQETARRELKEETGTDKAYFEFCGAFSDKGRDPRGWIVSQAFIAVLNEDDIANGHFEASGDASETKWFDLTVRKLSEKKQKQDNAVICDNDYELILEDSSESENQSDTLRAVVREQIEYCDYHELVTYDIIESQGIAFDHAKIIISVFGKLQRMLDSDVRIVFDFMPEYFTLTDLQEAVELISGQELIKPNFRRKIAAYVIETDRLIQNGGHRPAKAFVRNLERFYR